MHTLFYEIVETLREPLLVLSQDLRVLRANASFYRLFQVGPEEVQGKPFLSLGNGLWNVPALRSLLEEVVNLDHQFNDFEITRDFPRLGWKSMLLNGRQIVSERDITLVLLAIEDVTQRVTLEKQRQQLVSKLSRSNRELTDFAQVASHDLQEPLRKIQAFGSRLLESTSGTLSAESENYLARMLAAATRMQRLINDLLHLSHLETHAPEFKRVDLQDIAQEVLTDFETHLEETGGSVQVCQPLPIIEGDPLQMRQLLQNLIGNAIKYRKPGEPPRITVAGRIEIADADGVRSNMPWCELTVEDHGIGFDEKYLDRIFVVFQRLHGRHEYEGTGVGLAVCRKITERHGGQITARSTPGQGSTFLVRLPIRQPVQDATEHHSPTAALAVSAGVSLR